MELSEKDKRSRLSRAYFCFLILGLLTLPFGVVGLLDAWNATFEALVMVFFIPVLIAIICAAIYGLIQAVRFGHIPLAVISMISAVYLSVSIFPGFTSSSHAIPEKVKDTMAAIYISANVLIPGWWFTTGKRQYKVRV